MELYRPFQFCEALLLYLSSLHGPEPPKPNQIPSSNPPIRTLASKNIKLTRPSLPTSIATTAELDHYGTELFRLIRDENFQVKVHEIYPLRDVARAHQVSPALPPVPLSPSSLRQILICVFLLLRIASLSVFFGELATKSFF